MARQAVPRGNMKVVPLPREKSLFIEAAREARQSLSQWAIQAMIERAQRQGMELKRAPR